MRWQFPCPRSIKKVLLGKCTDIGFVDSIPFLGGYAETKGYISIKYSRVLRKEVGAQWDGSPLNV